MSGERRPLRESGPTSSGQRVTSPPLPGAMNGARTRRPTILVITYHFPPDGAVGGLRWHALSKYLARSGWNVQVVTAARVAAGDTVEGVSVEVCPRARTLNDLYNVLCGSRESAGSVRGDSATASAARPRPDPGDEGPPPSRTGTGLVGWVRNEISEMLAFPDHSRGWILGTARRVRSLIRRIAPDVVVSSGPPHTAHLVARLATVGTNVRWLMDMRDPWVNWAGDGPRVWSERQTLVSRATIPLERFVFRKADGIIVNTPELGATLKRVYPDLPNVWIPNGYDLERVPERLDPPFPNLAIAHAGTLYFNRSMTPVLEGFRLFLDRHGKGAAQSRLRTVGSVSPEHAFLMAADIKRLGLEDRVEQLGKVSQLEAAQLIRRSSVAVVLAQGQDIQVPAKLFESIALGVPTLVVTEHSSSAAREGRRIGAHIVDSRDVERIASLFTEVWNGVLPPTTCPAEISYESLTESLLSVL